MIRLSGNNHGFRHDGLILEKDWSKFETLTDEQRACLRDYHGTHVRIHPDDYGELAKLGLRLQEDSEENPQYTQPLVDINPKHAKADKVDAKIDNKSGVDKGDGKHAKADKVDAKKEG